MVDHLGEAKRLCLQQDFFGCSKLTNMTQKPPRFRGPVFSFRGWFPCRKTKWGGSLPKDCVSETLGGEFPPPPRGKHVHFQAEYPL